ncbi:MAG: AtpZ/AtpI family protein [Anaerolineales bacterium]|uniref:AtpZ/AtpI family protein n=1 Tax=Candidatus Villigracilis proximus TaxID=3140683 RepID=UPI0031351C73|nr:AtpZ/AtpI family protein [Anaerolineales bacterium]
MTQTKQTNRQNMVYTLLVVMIGQVGCITIAIILASVFGGVWLDNTFGTKPVFTLVLLFAGIPLSVFLMLYVAKNAGAFEGKIRSRREKKLLLRRRAWRPKNVPPGGAGLF